jgi:prepilin-type N-terminal cleavage/methylation domain-containing protein/prepilin-type processing-associated H-X9-DG protein
MSYRQFRGHGGRQGFTLIELLVAITIIGLLIGLLLPMLSKAKTSAKALVCLNHIRQLGLATETYRVDHSDYFPQPAQDEDLGSAEEQGKALWFNALDYYLMQQQKAYSSDDAEARNYDSYKQDPVWEEWSEDLRKNNRTIKMNEYLGLISHGEEASWKAYRGDEIREPSLTVLFVDGRAFDIRPTDIASSRRFCTTEARVGLRHEDGANVGFVDGHAAYVWQMVRTDTAAPSWFDGTNGPQELVWRVD